MTEHEEAVVNLTAAIKAIGPHLEALHNQVTYSPTSEGFDAITELRAAAFELSKQCHDMIWGADEDEDKNESENAN